MAFKTWQIKLPNGRTIEVKAAKDDVKVFDRAVSYFIRLRNCTKELNGIRGKNEYSMTSIMLGGICDDPIPHPAEYELDKTVYFAELPDLINAAELPAELKKVNDLFERHVRVKDNRRTEIEEEAIIENRKATYQRQEQERQQDTFAWLDTHGVSHEKIARPEGMMAIYAQYTYDNSDPMTDYFQPHASIGEKLLLALVPKQAETERIARAAVAKYPTLAAHEYEWHTEKWSMGHGNYLTSEYFAAEQVHKGEVRARLEIEFSSYEKEMYTYPGYPGNVSAQPVASSGNVTATMRLNAEHDGVEVRFKERPADEVLSILKSNGFRWSKPQKMWYARQSPATIRAAEQVTAA